MDVELINITDYAEYWKIDRKTVYRLIEIGTLTKYLDPDGNPLLNKNERPVGVKKYGQRKRKITKSPRQN